MEANKNKTIAKFENAEYGIEAQVAEYGDGSFSATLIDVDADKVVGIKIYSPANFADPKAAAIAQAKMLVA